MRSYPGQLRVLLAFVLFLSAPLFGKDTVTVAVASNFANTAAAVSAAYTATTGIPVRLVPGSTGKLYAQIVNGAPFDVFLAADSERPKLLEQSGLIAPAHRTTYATGSLVLWSRDTRYQGGGCRAALGTGDFDRLALANPDTAPYGAAAREFLLAAELWESVSRQAVFGENISQTLHFVATGNATLGFIARSQTLQPGLPAATCSWVIPQSAHAPLRQQAVLLARARDNDAARHYFAFLASAEAQEIIRQHGYTVAD